MMTIHQMVIQAATGTSSVQNRKIVLAAASSFAMVMQKLNQ